MSGEVSHEHDNELPTHRHERGQVDSALGNVVSQVVLDTSRADVFDPNGDVDPEVMVHNQAAAAELFHEEFNAYTLELTGLYVAPLREALGILRQIHDQQWSPDEAANNLSPEEQSVTEWVLGKYREKWEAEDARHKTQNEDRARQEGHLGVQTVQNYGNLQHPDIIQ